MWLRTAVVASMVAGCSGGAEIEANAVGFTRTTLTTSDGQDMPTSIWYPGFVDDESSPGLAEYALGAVGDGFADIEAATGPFPLVLLSHGNGGAGDAGAAISERIAASGFIVAAPDHTGNTFDDGFGSIDSFIEVFLRRPDDLRRVFDHVDAASVDEENALFDRFDGTVVVAGHSTGGSTALLAAGAGVDKTTIVLACALGEITGLACDIAEANDGRFIYPDLTGFPEVSAMVLMAPLSATLLEGDALNGVDVPTLVLVGDRDDITPEESNARPIFESLEGPRALGVFDGGGHYAFATLCDVEDLESLLPDAHQECTGPRFIDPATLIDGTSATASSWLEGYATEREEVDAIDAVAARFETLTLETAGL